MDRNAEVVAHLANATLNTFAILNKCLLNNKALKPGQLSSALKSTFNHPDADWGRFDYGFFRDLARLIDEAEERDRRPRT